MKLATVAWKRNSAAMLFGGRKVDELKPMGKKLPMPQGTRNLRPWTPKADNTESNDDVNVNLSCSMSSDEPCITEKL